MELIFKEWHGRLQWRKLTEEPQLLLDQSNVSTSVALFSIELCE